MFGRKRDNHQVPRAGTPTMETMTRNRSLGNRVPIGSPYLSSGGVHHEEPGRRSLGGQRGLAIEEIDIEEPAPGEVLVKWQAAGLCHSDEHFVTGDLVMPEEVRQQAGVASPFPIVGGHEGAGVVVEVGTGVGSVGVGDSVAASFIPACGQCRYCVTGRQSLCNQGSQLMQRGQMVDGVVRHFCQGEPLNLMCKCGTFAEHSLVSEQSVVKVDSDLPPAAVALVSCGVATGGAEPCTGPAPSPGTLSWWWASEASGSTPCRVRSWPVLGW